MADLSTEFLSYQTKLIALLESLNSGESGGTTILPTRLTLINMVKIKLDELIPEGEGVIYDLETSPNISNPYDLYINGLLDEAALNVLQIAPKEILKPKNAAIATGTQYDANTGYVVVPADYVRLHSFKMSNWAREVEEPITKADPLYKLQGNAFVRGGTKKPILVLNYKVISSVVTKILEYYSVVDSHNIDKFLYIAETAAENMDDSLYPVLTWMCAGIILQNLKEFDLSTKAMERVQLNLSNLK